MKKIHSLRFKISILYSTILFLILLLFNGIIYFSARHILYEELDEKLQIKAEEIATALNTYANLHEKENESLLSAAQRIVFFDGTVGTQTALTEFEKEWLNEARQLNIAEDYINFLDARQESIVSSSDFNSQVKSFLLRRAPFSVNKVVFDTSPYQGGALRMINYPFAYKDKFNHVLQIGSSVSPVERILRKLLVFMGGGIVFILLMTSFVGRIFVQRILQPVAAVTKTAHTISHKDLHKRINIENTDSEMRFLINSFNDMISRLEESFRHISDFSSHVAHELKTPLAILQGELGYALEHGRESDEYKRVIHVALDEVERLSVIIEDLLLLAKLDYAQDVFSFSDFDFIEFIKEKVHEPAHILAEEKGITMMLETNLDALVVNGDAKHLRRLFFNVLHNAIKYTPHGGSITISISKKHGKVVCAISDTGTGIHPDDQKKIFSKFFRGKSRNDEGEPGSGLGLSIALSIAHAHGGDIAVESTLDRGSMFIVSLPIIH